MEIERNQEYYHDRLHERVTVVMTSTESDYAIVRKSSDGKSISTHVSHLKEIVDMTGDEILKREG